MTGTGEALLQIAFLALGLSVFAIVVAKSLMLEALRKRVERWRPWAGYLLRCTFCIMGWTSIVLTLGYRPQLLQDLFDAELVVSGFNTATPLNFFVSFFALWGSATLSYRILWPFLERHAPKLRMQSKSRKQK